MKRTLAVLSSAALLLTMLSVMITTVYAAAPITYTVESVQHTGAIAQEEELTVNVSSSELASFYGAALTVNYDSAQLELVTAEAAGWLGDILWGNPVDTSTAGKIVVNASNMFPFSSAADEVFLTVTFKALADIETDAVLTLTDATVTQGSGMFGQTAIAEAADVVDGGFVIADDSTTTTESEPSDTTTASDTTTETAGLTDTTNVETTTELVTSSTGETTDTTTTAVMTYTVQTVEHSGAVATDEEIWIDVYGSELSSFYKTAFTVTYDDTQFALSNYEKDGFLAEVNNATIDTDTAGEIAVSINNNRNALSCAADEVVLTLVFKALVDIEDDAVIGLSAATVTLERRPGSTAFDAATVNGGVKILPIITGTSVTLDTTETTGESTTTDTMPDPTETILSTTAVTTGDTTVSTDATDTTTVATAESTTTVATTAEVTSTATETDTTTSGTDTSASVTESTTETTESQTTTSATVTTAEGTEILFTVGTVEYALSKLSVGTLIEVPLSATALDAFAEMSMTVRYDSDKLQYVACSKTTEETWFENGDVTEDTAGQLILEVSLGFGSFGGNLQSNGGVFATLIFKVKSDLAAGDILALTAENPAVVDRRGRDIAADCISGAILVAPETTTSSEVTTGTTAPTDGSTTAPTANTTTTPTTATTETSASTDATAEPTTSTTESTDSTTETTESTTVTDPTTTTTVEPTATTTIETAAPTETTTATESTASTEVTESTETTESTTAPTDAAPEKGNGDTDGNGTINIQDAVQCYYHVNGKIVLKEDAQARADVSDPIGSLTIRDAVTVYYLVNGKIDTL